MHQQTKCSVCGKLFTFDFEATPLPTSGPMVIPTPLFVSHCSGGNTVPVPGKLTKFWEVINSKLVEVKPHISDGLN